MGNQPPMQARLVWSAQAGGRFAQRPDALDYGKLRQNEIGAGRAIAAAKRKLLGQVTIATGQVERKHFEFRTMGSELIVYEGDFHVGAIVVLKYGSFTCGVPVKVLIFAFGVVLDRVERRDDSCCLSGAGVFNADNGID